ncbi:mitochondrial fission 1 protein isoform X2 [Cuculus canorus]|uniref:mitochondrial fission 1 protein isoform X2 n=1 Tax=Cuculus canorus TaxID=55661 RepID=UPI0023AAC402|nr:mitochondrial fission 1 protein isoform X2 [Cuculus canorus]
MDPEFEDPVAVEDLIALERRYALEARGGSVSRRCQFEYGWGLVRSPYGHDIQKGVTLLQELLPGGSQEEQRDCSFYLALGNLRLREYERALTHIERLLANEPHNQQGQRLRRLIRQHMERAGLLGLGVLGALVLGVAGLAGLGVAIARGRR